MVFLQKYFLWFFMYSIIGWIWEVIVCSVPARKFINRGFLNGPYCPIYGAGAILVIILLNKIENPLLLFITGAIVTCTLEYTTSWIMEKLFNARWWDYTGKLLNINGRVCLRGAVAFGILSVVVIKFIHPVFIKYISLLSEGALSVISLVLFVIFLIDAVYTIARFSDFKDKLKEFSEKLAEKLQENDFHSRITDSTIHKKFNFQERRIIKAFPRLKSARYDEALQKIKASITKKNNKNNRKHKENDEYKNQK